MCCHLSGLPPHNSGIGSETHSFPHFSSMSSIAPIFRNTWLFHYFLPRLTVVGVMNKLDVLDTLNIYVHHGDYFTTAITILLTIAH